MEDTINRAMVRVIATTSRLETLMRSPAIHMLSNKRPAIRTLSSNPIRTANSRAIHTLSRALRVERMAEVSASLPVSTGVY